MALPVLKMLEAPGTLHETGGHPVSHLIQSCALVRLQSTPKGHHTSAPPLVDAVRGRALRLLDRDLGVVGEREKWWVSPANSQRDSVFDGRFRVWTPWAMLRVDASLTSNIEGKC